MRSFVAVLAGFVAVAVLSLATDQVLHVLNVYPPWGEPMWDPMLNLLALTYRTIFTIAGGYITATLAPREPMRHVFILGCIGTVFGVLGAVTSITMTDLGPDWYPILLAVTGFPAIWIGGVLRTRPSAMQSPL
jgi:hypothetical protein